MISCVAVIQGCRLEVPGGARHDFIQWRHLSGNSIFVSATSKLFGTQALTTFGMAWRACVALCAYDTRRT